MLTRQLARTATGGKAPRKSLRQQGFSGSNEEERRYQVNISEWKERFQNNGGDENLIEFVNNQYKNCDDLVKRWIYLDLKENRIKDQEKKRQETTIDESLLKKLDDNSKYEVLQFVQTYSPVKSANKMEGSTCKSDYRLDSNLVTFHKMRSINQHFNKIMMKKILTLKQVMLVTNSVNLKYFQKLSLAQARYKRKLESDRNYDLDSVFLFENSSPVNPHELKMEFGGYFGNGITTPNFPSDNNSNLAQQMFDPFNNNFSEDDYIGNIFFKKKEKKNQYKVDIEYLKEDINMYCKSSTDSTNTTMYLPESPYVSNDSFNEVVEVLTLIVEDYMIPHFVQICSNVKTVNLLFNKTEQPFFGFGICGLENFASNSVEELLISGNDLLDQLQNQPYFLNPFCGTSCPNLKSITFSPLIPSQYTQDNVLEFCFSQLQAVNPLIDKLNIYEKIGRNKTLFIKSETFATTNTQPRELNVYCVQSKSLLNIQILEELYEKFGDYFVGNIMSNMVLSYASSPSLDNDQLLWKSFYSVHLKEFKETADYFFKTKLPISLLILPFFNRFTMDVSLMKMNVKDIKLQYIIYLCNQYHNSELLSQSFLNSIETRRPNFAIPSMIDCGWNFTKHTNDVLEYFARHGIHTGVSAMLSNFSYEEKFIASLLKFFSTSTQSVDVKPVVTELTMHLFKKDAKFLYSTLAQKVQLEGTNPFTVPLFTLLFSKIESYLVCKIIDSMDMEIFNSMGQNERGDTILHILLYLKLDFDYHIFYSILKKNPNMINMANNKLQTPLHYLMLSPERRRSSLVLQEITQQLLSANISLDVNIKDYMEQTPISILKSEEYEHSDIIYDQMIE